MIIDRIYIINRIKKSKCKFSVRVLTDKIFFIYVGICNSQFVFIRYVFIRILVALSLEQTSTNWTKVNKYKNMRTSLVVTFVYLTLGNVLYLQFPTVFTHLVPTSDGRGTYQAPWVGLGKSPFFFLTFAHFFFFHILPLN